MLPFLNRKYDKIITVGEDFNPMCYSNRLEVEFHCILVSIVSCCSIVSFPRRDIIFGVTKISQRTCGEKVYDKIECQTELCQQGYFCAIKIKHLQKNNTRKTSN